MVAPGLLSGFLDCIEVSGGIIGFQVLPCVLKRVGTESHSGPENVWPNMQKLYHAVDHPRTLEEFGSLPADVKPGFVSPGATSGAVPKDFRTKADVPLTATALEAIRVPFLRNVRSIFSTVLRTPQRNLSCIKLPAA